MKMHSFPREVHFVQGCFKSHLTLDSAQAWHDLRRDLFWLRLRSREFLRGAPDLNKHSQVTAASLVPREEVTTCELGETRLGTILSVKPERDSEYRTSQR